MVYLTAALFFGATTGHFALTTLWLRRRWRERLGSPEELLFLSVLIGLGSLQAVLHILACSVGISLLAGVLALAGLHALAFALGRTPQQPPASSAARSGPASQEWVAWGTSLIGAGAMVLGVLSWLCRAADSLQIPGIDAAHYHVPYAVNYAHGTGVFGFAATPHLYPMGTSVLAAWLFQGGAGPLLLDLTNLLPCLLLYAALAYLFRLLTGEPAAGFVPVMFLLLFTGRLFRVSLFISADLFYAASFAALFAGLLGVWVRDALDQSDWVALSFATGMLLSQKIQGLMSAALLLGIGALALAARRLWRGGTLRAFLPAAGDAALCAGLVVASGGIWLLRSWWRFGSPMAPAGLSLLGATIFPGLPGRSADAPLSVLKDMQSIPGYDLWARFRFYTADWVGAWPWWFAGGLLVLLVDAAYQLATRRRLDRATAHKLAALAFFSTLAYLHVYILAGVTFSSLEWLRGQTLRFVLPFFALYALLAYSGVISRSTSWARHVSWPVLAGLVYLLLGYNARTQMPAQWQRAWGAENLLDHRLLPVAVALVLPGFIGAPVWRRRARYVCAAVAVLFALLLVQRVAVQQGQLDAQARGRVERDLQQLVRTGKTAALYRGAYYRAIAYQRRANLSCPRLRFFTASRFDFPADLQDPAFSNVVFDVQNEKTRIQPLLERDGPGSAPCDFVIAVHTAADDAGTHYPAVSADALRELLQLRGELRAIGDSGRYRIYHVQPG